MHVPRERTWDIGLPWGCSAASGRRFRSHRSLCSEGSLTPTAQSQIFLAFPAAVRVKSWWKKKPACLLFYLGASPKPGLLPCLPFPNQQPGRSGCGFQAHVSHQPDPRVGPSATTHQPGLRYREGKQELSVCKQWAIAGRLRTLCRT